MWSRVKRLSTILPSCKSTPKRKKLGIIAHNCLPFSCIERPLLTEFTLQKGPSTLELPSLLWPNSLKRALRVEVGVHLSGQSRFNCPARSMATGTCVLGTQ